MSTGTWPPPVTFPEGPPPAHPPPGAGATSQGVKSASPSTFSPVPPGLLGFIGPVDEFHQLHSALTVPTWLPASTSSPSPAGKKNSMLFSWITTFELGPPTAPKKLRRMALAVPPIMSLLRMLRSVLLSRMRRVALTGLSVAVVLLVTLLLWKDDMWVLKRIKARAFRLNEFVEISRLKAPPFGSTLLTSMPATSWPMNAFSSMRTFLTTGPPTNWSV